MAKEEKKSVKTQEKKKSTPVKLIDGTICYTVAVRYPSDVLKSLRTLCYEKEFKNMTDTVFYCIEGHSSLFFKNKQLLGDYDYNKKDVKSLTIRFREKHYEYIKKISEARNYSTFSKGLINVVYEFLRAEERI